MTTPPVHEAPTPGEERIRRLLDQVADAFSHRARSPVLHSPAEHGLDFENVTFPSRDGTLLEGWFIPAPGSDKLVANHPMGFTRAGLPAHLEPWRSIRARSGNGSRSTSSPTTRSSTGPATTSSPTTRATTA